MTDVQESQLHPEEGTLINPDQGILFTEVTQDAVEAQAKAPEAENPEAEVLTSPDNPFPVVDPETEPTTQENSEEPEVQKQPRKRRFKWLALGVAGAVAVVGLSVGVKAATTESTAGGPVAMPLGYESTPSGEFDPATDPTTGTIRPALLQPGETSMTIAHPNGKWSFEVHDKLSDPDNTEAFINSFVDLWMCKVTTGDIACDEALAPNLQPGVLNTMLDGAEEQRASLNIAELATPDYSSEYIKTSVYDDPNDPAVWEKTKEGDHYTYTLKSGKVFFAMSDHTPERAGGGWQQTDGHMLPSYVVMPGARIDVERLANGDVAVTGADMNIPRA